MHTLDTAGRPGRSAGGGTRTRDTRIMIPLPGRSSFVKALQMGDFRRLQTTLKYPLSGPFRGHSGPFRGQSAIGFRLSSQ